MSSPSDRCSTTSGIYRCDLRAGHAGECECEAPSIPWVGPAMASLPRVVGGQEIVHGARKLPGAAATLRQDGVSPPDAPPPPEAA